MPPAGGVGLSGFWASLPLHESPRAWWTAFEHGVRLVMRRVQDLDDPPQLYSITPTSGPSNGAGVITITGSGRRGCLLRCAVVAAFCSGAGRCV